MEQAPAPLKTTRMNATTTAETAREMRQNGIVVNRSQNAILVPDCLGEYLLGIDAQFVPKNWARSTQRTGLTPAIRPDCECGGHLNADLYDSGRAPTCSNCPHPRPTGTQSLRATVSMTYEASLSNHEDGFTLVVRDAPKKRATKRSQSERGGVWETVSNFCLAAVRLRSLNRKEFRMTESSGRYGGLLSFCPAVTPSGVIGILPVSSAQIGQVPNVQMTTDPLALITGPEAPLGVITSYGATGAV